MTDGDNAATLYRRGSGALVRDEAGDVLLVKPAYKEVWEIPGGVIEPGESPRTCCVREVREELGLDLPIGRLLVVDWLPPEPAGNGLPSQPDGWMFVYDAGVITQDVTERIVLPPEELLEWRFVALDALDGYVSDRKVRRLHVAHACALDGTCADLELGYRPAR